MDISTDFEYKDDRTYVHSSTLCEFVSDSVCPQLGINAADIRLDAQFHRVVTNNGIMRCQDAPNESRAHTEIAAEFRLVHGGKMHYIYFIEGDKPVEKRIRTKYNIEDLQNTAPFEGSCQIDVSNTLALLENTIEANKRLHQAAFMGRSVKVVNMYMKKFPLGVRSDNTMRALNIRHIGARNHNDGLTTLNRLSFVDSDIPAFEMCYFIPGVVA